VRVHYDEGVANHIDPESCAGIREGAGGLLMTRLSIAAARSRRGLCWMPSGHALQSVVSNYIQRRPRSSTAGMMTAGERTRISSSTSSGTVCCRDTEKGGQTKRDVSYSCVKDEGRPLGISFQEQVSNHSKLLRSKAVVVSVGAKLGT